MESVAANQLKSRIPCNFHHCFDQFSAQHGYTSREVECNPFDYMCKCKEGYKEDMGECRKCEYKPPLQTLNTILSTPFEDFKHDFPLAQQKSHLSDFLKTRGATFPDRKVARLMFASFILVCILSLKTCSLVMWRDSVHVW